MCVSWERIGGGGRGGGGVCFVLHACSPSTLLLFLPSFTMAAWCTAIAAVPHSLPLPSQLMPLPMTASGTRSC